MSQFHGQGQGGVVFVVLNGNDGLPADPQHPGQIFLTEPCLLTQLFHSIPHGCSPGHQQETRKEEKGPQGNGSPQHLGGAVGFSVFFVVLHHLMLVQHLGKALDADGQAEDQAGDQIGGLFGQESLEPGGAGGARQGPNTAL